MTRQESLALRQRSLADPALEYPLWPPVTGGCPGTSTAELAYPVEVDYAYDDLDTEHFLDPQWGNGLDRWAPLLPPLTTPGLGEGSTPTLDLGDDVYIKDESRNPTWSHKDRLNRCAVSGAAGAGASAVVVASSGNHGASAAAFAARAGLRCVVLASAGMPAAVDSFLHAYGATVLSVPAAARWPLTRRLVTEHGLHPVSNIAVTHTGHPFGPEGYKTLAYELVAELGVPGSVFVPTGYGELLFGVWKGFVELHRLGITARIPRLFGCEPAAGGPMTAALQADVPAARVTVGATDAYGISAAVGGYRGVAALRHSNGEAVLVSDGQMRAAQTDLAHRGLWTELSGAAGLAALHQRRNDVDDVPGPVVCVATSSGFKDRGVATTASPTLDPEGEELWGRLRQDGLV